ncbi:MAG: RHS repeat domain-containing protein, partial [Candidatus Onthovivens sp.]|nr:RHS repeat domain-containing protein [Candidatus Onthovivens sp.]
MLVHSSGPYSLDIKVTEKVLSTTLNNNFYDLTSTGLILYKLECPTGDFAIEHLLKSTLTCNIKVHSSTTIVFDLCFISSIDFNKNNPFDMDLTDIINRISYTYDGFGNVNSVTFAESITQTGTTTHYVYDALNRLIKSYINPENPNIYSYDSNGNILSKNGVSYVYDPVYKDRLMSVGNDVIFEYNSSSPLFPTKIIKGNNVFNLVWNTNRLESVNDISFVYDHFKRRIKKIRGNCVTKYFYNGESLEAIEISENNNTYKFIYHYDENGKLIGFSYNDNEYLFIRDILGNIRSIYGINEGTYLVNYSYDDRGQPTITSNNNEIGNLLAQKNCILYKG